MQWSQLTSAQWESAWLSSLTTYGNPNLRAAIIGYPGAIDESDAKRFDSGVGFQRPALSTFR